MCGAKKELFCYDSVIEKAIEHGYFITEKVVLINLHYFTIWVQDKNSKYKFKKNFKKHD